MTTAEALAWDATLAVSVASATVGRLRLRRGDRRAVERRRRDHATDAAFLAGLGLDPDRLLPAPPPLPAPTGPASPAGRR